MTKDEALKMAIEAFERWEDTYKADCTEVINACKEALEQPVPPAKTTSLEDVIKEFEKDPEMKALLDLARKQVKGMELKQPAQEPVAFRHKTTGEFCTGGFELKALNQWIPIYTHPHQWQGLTDDEIARLVLINEVDKSGDTGFARLIEQALKEKNT
jgi:hypothetical protein